MRPTFRADRRARPLIGALLAAAVVVVVTAAAPVSHGVGTRRPHKTTSVHSEDGTRQLTIVSGPTTPNGMPEFLASEALTDEVFCDER
ncbi:hypothetical protein [Actinomadura alba]|uniref:Uncharacterized protein n=1 Tax=Actinomadura alba TaxID=406431 RepID=A0ABR7LPW8_9ACTN|nr:hypothetical protein [Actinomadura alba]MBC6466894.1 hypothetical protein [Actinomadura alba]